MTIEEIRRKKKEYGYTNAQMAEKSGLPLATVQKVLGGTTKSPRFQTLLALSSVFAKEQGSYTYSSTQADGRAAGMVREPGAAYGTAAAYTLPSEQANERYPRQGSYTLDDYLALPDEQRVELIDGVIYDMSAPTGFHQLIAGQLYAMILAFIQSKKGKCLPFISPIDVQLDCDNRTIVQPDVIILCDTGKYTPARIVGAPDFVVEVLSPSTRAKDVFIKLNKYRSAGVREYWMVDPKKKKVYVYHFEQDDDFEVYSFRDQIPVGIYGGELVIDFSVIDDYVSPWMQ